MRNMIKGIAIKTLILGVIFTILTLPVSRWELEVGIPFTEISTSFFLF